MSEEYDYGFTDEMVSVVVFHFLEEMGKKYLKNVEFSVDVVVEVCIDDEKYPDARLHVPDFYDAVKQFLDFGRFRPPPARNRRPHEVTDEEYKMLSITFFFVLQKIGKKHLKMTDFIVKVGVTFDYDEEEHPDAQRAQELHADVHQFLRSAPGSSWLEDELS